MHLKTILEYWKTCGQLHGGKQERTGRGRSKDDCQVSSLNDLAVNSEYRRRSGFESVDLEALTWRYMEVK